jgi:hypothetical protein
MCTTTRQVNQEGHADPRSTRGGGSAHPDKALFVGYPLPISALTGFCFFDELNQFRNELVD